MLDQQNQLVINQWVACASTFIVIPDEIIQEIRLAFEKCPAVDILKWYERFSHDLDGHPLAYKSASNDSEKAYTESHIENYLISQGFMGRCAQITAQPTVFLTHDIDHLYPTTRLMLKRFISERRFTNYSSDSFLLSLERLLEFDRGFLGGGGSSRLYIAAPLAARSAWKLAYQQLIDPSYHVNDRQFDLLISLIEKYSCAVGLHGSYFSLTDNLILGEKKALENKLGRPISSVRQHWLRLPNAQSLHHLSQAGFKTDSTLGWNNAGGFRGGMARSFPIIFKDGSRLLEQPLNLMDCSMGDMNQAKKIIDEVRRRSGEICLNWHERSATPEQDWFGQYKRIIEQLIALGFTFNPVSRDTPL
jgi:hypothetical protein